MSARASIPVETEARRHQHSTTGRRMGNSAVEPLLWPVQFFFPLFVWTWISDSPADTENGSMWAYDEFTTKENQESFDSFIRPYRTEHRQSKYIKNCDNTENFYVIDLVTVTFSEMSLLTWNAMTRMRWMVYHVHRTTGTVTFRSLARAYKNETVAFTTAETLGHFAYSMCSFLLHLHCSPLI